MTVCRAAQLIRERELSVLELTEAVLEVLDRTETLVHAYAYVDPQQVREAARRADAELAHGMEPRPLHGIPVGLKDVVYTADQPTEAGSRILAGFVPEVDATVTQLLRDAGALIIGKLVTHEFAYGQDSPPTRNSWHLDHYPGGSSVGAGVAVAIGSTLAAIGTDGGGSVRKPAALNGVTGLKPTYGLVSHQGVLPVGSSLDHVGILARTADDCALLLEVLGRFDPSDPASVRWARFHAPEDQWGDLAGRRIGVLPYAADPDVIPEIRDAVDGAVGRLAELGATIVEVDFPPFELVEAAASTIFLSEAATFHHRWLRERPHDYVPATRRVVVQGALISALESGLAQKARRRICAATAGVFRRGKLDAVVSPTSPITSMPMAEMDSSVDVGRFVTYLLTPNLTGQPAISVPCGLTSDRLPIGLQIMGAPFADDVVLSVAAQYQRNTTWHEFRPDIVSTTDVVKTRPEAAWYL